mmetsp:Transcript_11834/g.27350  ORF Transcript_11834/g.27350 Transcript_11834/m.27350 type:complete len:327 (-) Transcript_11834:373-1353(-)
MELAGLGAVFEFDLERRDKSWWHAGLPVQKLHHLATRPRMVRGLADTELDPITDGKAETVPPLLEHLLCQLAFGERLVERLGIEIHPDENELALSWLTRRPTARESALELMVDRMVDVLELRVGDGKHTFHAVHALPIGCTQLAEPLAHKVKVEQLCANRSEMARRALVDAVARDAAIVHHFDAPRIQEARLHSKQVLHVATSDVEHKVDRDSSLLTALDAREAVDVRQPRLDAPEVLLARHKVDLIEQQPVGKGHLCHCLVDGAFLLLLVEVLLDVSRVDHRDDTVQPAERLDERVDEEGLRHRSRRRHARRLDHDRIDFAPARS